MNVLLDACVAASAASALRTAGHDVHCVTDWPVDPGDDEIIRRAGEAGRVLVTLDKDFGELAIVHRRSHTGIVRLVGFRAVEQGRQINAALAAYGSDLLRGAIVTVEPGRVRVRPPDDAA